MRRRLAVVVLVLVAGCVSGCGSTTETTPSAQPGVTTAGNTSAPDSGSEDVGPTKKIFKEQDTTITVAVGEKFGIRVSENASVGDAWKMVSQPDDRVLKTEGDSYKPEGGEPKPGAGGQREFKFKARAAGTTTVTLFDCYRCPASGEVSPENSALARRVTFSVTVG